MLSKSVWGYDVTVGAWIAWAGCFKLSAYQFGKKWCYRVDAIDGLGKQCLLITGDARGPRAAMLEAERRTAVMAREAIAGAGADRAQQAGHQVQEGEGMPEVAHAHVWDQGRTTTKKGPSEITSKSRWHCRVCGIKAQQVITLAVAGHKQTTRWRWRTPAATSWTEGTPEEAGVGCTP